MSKPASALQHEIRQTVPFRNQEQEVALSILRTADHIRRLVSHVVGPHGISPEQYNVLRILRGAGEAGLPTLEVADRMVEHAPAITRLMDKLECKALVRRLRCPEDRRRVLCFVTPEGLQLLSELDVPVDEISDRTFTSLSPADLKQLIELLARVRSVASDPTTTSKLEGNL